jgi:NAD(P)H-dependent nitrite reductase small subunit
MVRWLRVCAEADLAADRGLVVEIEGRPIALFRDGDAVRGLDARCPHAAGPLGRGWVEHGAVVCPLHHWRFRLDDGRCTSVEGVSVRVYRCLIREGDVWIAT